MSTNQKREITDYNVAKVYNYYTFVQDEILAKIAKETNTTVEDMILSLNEVKKIMTIWHLNKYEFFNLFEQAGITVQSLFSYSENPSPNKTFYTIENAVYRVKYEWNRGNLVQTKKFFNIYVVENQYSAVSLNIMSKLAFEWRFPLISDTFSIEMEKYTTEEKKWLKSLNLSSNIKDVNVDIPTSVNLTLRDVVNYFTNPNSFKEKKKKNLFNIYSTSSIANPNDYDIYLKLGRYKIRDYEYDISLTIPVKALFEKDFKLIEDKFVHFIPNKNFNSESDYFFEGKQKDCWYFELEQVKTLKKLFKELVF